MDVEIIRLNNNKILLSDYGINTQDFIVSSIPITGVYGDSEGSDRKINYGAEYGTRTIRIPFLLEAVDYFDLSLSRDEVFTILTSKDPFYVRELRMKMNEDYNVKYASGKVYKVRTYGNYDIDQIYKYGFGEVTLETVELPFAESIGTTQDIQNNGINAEDELWGFGMGLEAIDETLIYKHNAVAGQRFRVFNAGNVSVHPFEQDFKMTISNVIGSTEIFQITNHTNGSRSRINVPLKSTDKVIYDGPNVTRNGLEFLRDTRKDFIELSPGWNEFEIYYCESATIEFDFRFYYK